MPAGIGPPTPNSGGVSQLPLHPGGRLPLPLGESWGEGVASPLKAPPRSSHRAGHARRGRSDVDWRRGLCPKPPEGQDDGVRAVAPLALLILYPARCRRVTGRGGSGEGDALTPTLSQREREPAGSPRIGGRGAVRWPGAIRESPHAALTPAENDGRRSAGPRAQDSGRRTCDSRLVTRDSRLVMRGGRARPPRLGSGSGRVAPAS